MSLSNLKAGQCASIGSYEKLNQLGEGSKQDRQCIVPTALLTRSSLRRRLPGSRPSKLSSRCLEASTNISRRAAERSPSESNFLCHFCVLRAHFELWDPRLPRLRLAPTRDVLTPENRRSLRYAKSRFYGL